MIRRPWLLLLVSCVSLPARAQTHATQHDLHRVHADPAAYIASLEDPSREAWQKPGEVVAALGLRPGDVVADIGAGSGYFTFRFVAALGDRGRVYAVDVSQPMIDAVTAKAAGPGVRPGAVAPILARPDDPLLPAASVDTIFVCDTWHHIEDRVAYARRLKGALRPGGRVVIVDFHKHELPIGPGPEMKLSRDEMVHDFEAAGYRLAKQHDFLPYQYFLEFVPAPR